MSASADYPPIPNGVNRPGGWGLLHKRMCEEIDRLRAENAALVARRDEVMRRSGQEVERLTRHTVNGVDDILKNDRVQRRLAGEPHQHHSECIHNLTPDEQIALRGWTRERWVAMGLEIPSQITPDEWVTGDQP